MSNAATPAAPATVCTTVPAADFTLARRVGGGRMEIPGQTTLAVTQLTNIGHHVFVECTYDGVQVLLQYPTQAR